MTLCYCCKREGKNEEATVDVYRGYNDRHWAMCNKCHLELVKKEAW